MAKTKGTTEKKPRTAEKATKAKKLPTFTGEREVAMVLFNTPEITTAAILSLRKHGGEKYHVTISELMEWNNLNDDKILEGQTLIIKK